MIRDIDEVKARARREVKEAEEQLESMDEENDRYSWWEGQKDHATRLLKTLDGVDSDYGAESGQYDH